MKQDCAKNFWSYCKDKYEALAFHKVCIKKALKNLDNIKKQNN